VYSQDKAVQNSGKGKTKDLREASENVRKAQDEETADTTPVDPKKTGNKPRFDRDR
jgi:hypothetical protein